MRRRAPRRPALQASAMATRHRNGERGAPPGGAARAMPPSPPGGRARCAGTPGNADAFRLRGAPPPARTRTPAGRLDAINASVHRTDPRRGALLENSWRVQTYPAATSQGQADRRRRDPDDGGAGGDSAAMSTPNLLRRSLRRPRLRRRRSILQPSGKPACEARRSSTGSGRRRRDVTTRTSRRRRSAIGGYEEAIDLYDQVLQPARPRSG